MARLDASVTREEYLRDYVAPARCTNLADFLARAPKGFRLMQSEAALRAVTEDLFEQLVDDGVVYAEIRFAPLLHLEQGLTAERVVAVVERAAEELMRATGVEAGLILCTLRHFSAEQSLETARLVEQFRGSGWWRWILQGMRRDFLWMRMWRRTGLRGSMGWRARLMPARRAGRRACGRRCGCSIRNGLDMGCAASRMRGWWSI